MKLETIHGLCRFGCLSALQKCIRRGMEREAMLFACEIAHADKTAFATVLNRLEIISHEDIGLAAPAVVVFVATTLEQARRFYDPEKPGKWRMMVGNAIRAMCRAAKSREGDHFQAAIGARNLEFGLAPEIPDWAHDKHTQIGRRKGRGLDHFRDESARLVPAPEKKDPYEDEAYDVWKQKELRAAQPTKQRKHVARGGDSQTSSGSLF